LAAFNPAGVMADPRLELYNGTTASFFGGSLAGNNLSTRCRSMSMTSKRNPLLSADDGGAALELFGCCPVGNRDQGEAANNLYQVTR
jgi:hypothetical protein